MKTLRSSSTLLVKAFLVMLFTLANCSEPVEDGRAPELSADQWTSLADPANLMSSIVVQRDASLQEAIDAANPGQVIYIEPGKYNESISVEKNDIKLIGMNGPDGEKVVIENLNLTSDLDAINIYRSEADIPSEDIEGFFQPNDLDLNTLFSARPGSQQGRGHFSPKLFYHLFSSVRRTELSGGIAHYEFEIPLGLGQFDVVRIHRVVRESRPCRPIRTKGDIFMVHGAAQDFDDIFLTAGSENPNAQTSSPIYLASKNIDVWGIDLAWTLVPLETTDFSFMQNWGIQRDLNHTLAAITIARLIRGLTGQGFGRMNLLGFSYSVAIAYAAAGQETQKHTILRNIKGIIPTDFGMKYDDSDEANASRIVMCKEAIAYKTAIDGGTYHTRLGVMVGPIGAAAISAPDGPSPNPALTNSQLALAIGTNPPASPSAPSWHFVAGNINALSYSDPARWFKLLTVLAPYQPQLTGYEYRVCLCDEEESYLDDHLNEISVPILYLGAGGGFGDLGSFSANNTSSTDVTIFTLSKVAERAADYGHADLWMATNATTDGAWEMLHQWLLDHNSNYP
jgi:hypothetical protein